MFRWNLLIVFLLLSLIGMQQSMAQKLPMPTDDLLDQQEEGKWDFSLRIGLDGSQTYFRAWAQGGADRIAVSGSSTFRAVYSSGPYQYATRLDLRYGQTRQNRGEFRKSDDLIRLRNQFFRRFDDERFSLIGNINLETQFDKGYDRAYEVVQSRFFAPATVTQTAGLSYIPDDAFDLTVGLSLRQTFISDTTLSERYGLDKGDWFRNEAGYTVIIRYEKEIWENVTYSGFLETFSNMQKSLLSTDVIFVNELEGRINDNLRTRFEFSLQYNDDITKELQIKQILTVGLNVSFF